MSGENSSENVTYRSLDFLGYPRYRVGDDGSVWSRAPENTGKFSLEEAERIRERYETKKCSQEQLAREFGCCQTNISLIVKRKILVEHRWKKLSPGTGRGGQLNVALCNGDRKVFKVHRLVLLAFVGPCPEGMEGCHFPDRDPANNRLDNLRWDTKKANEADKRFHGTNPIGSRHGSSKLTEEAVDQIKRLRTPGNHGSEDVARQFGVSSSTIRMIWTRRIWRHV